MRRLRFRRKLIFLSVFSLSYLFLPQITFSQEQHEVIVISPFKIVNEDERLQWLKDGMPEALTARFGAYPVFRIIERSQLNRAIEELGLAQSGIVDAKSAKEVGKILGASSILLGSVQGFGYKVNISLRFIDVESGEVAMTEGITGNLSEIFSLQDRLSDKVIRTMQLKHDLQKRMGIEKVSTNSIWAYLLYKKGEEEDPAYRGKDINLAIWYYLRAIQLDRNFEEALYHLANAHFLKKDSKGCEYYLNKVIEIRPYNPKSYINLGKHYALLKDYGDAIINFKKALNLNPKEINAYLNIGHVYFNKGEYKEAMDYYSNVLKIDSNNEEAKQWIEKAINKIKKNPEEN